jgi:hypothetical protein
MGNCDGELDIFNRCCDIHRALLLVMIDIPIEPAGSKKFLSVKMGLIYKINSNQRNCAADARDGIWDFTK